MSVGMTRGKDAWGATGSASAMTLVCADAGFVWARSEGDQPGR